ncbi:40S ribosomal protein S3a [Glycine soja]|uniref:40S ribosomal protein S3a n=1 Tax=Glycine soja TaxID=3848 RepID=A0A445JUP3_GLYSO|nr:40S ribosomal protein S3a [Glycine soja]
MLIVSLRKGDCAKRCNGRAKVFQESASKGGGGLSLISSPLLSVLSLLSAADVEPIVIVKITIVERSCSGSDPIPERGVPVDVRIPPQGLRQIPVHEGTHVNKPLLQSLDDANLKLPRYFDKLSIPLNEQKSLANVIIDVVLNSVFIATTHCKTLEKVDIIFCSIFEAIKNLLKEQNEESGLVKRSIASRTLFLLCFGLKHRVFEVSLVDLQGDEDHAFKKIRLRAEDVQGKNVLTNLWTTDNYTLRMFCIGVTKRITNQVKRTYYAQSSQIRQIYRKMREIMTNQTTSYDLKELVRKFILQIIRKEIEKATSSIYPQQNVFDCKVKILKHC